MSSGAQMATLNVSDATAVLDSAAGDAPAATPLASRDLDSQHQTVHSSRQEHRKRLFFENTIPAPGQVMPSLTYRTRAPSIEHSKRLRSGTGYSLLDIPYASTFHPGCIPQAAVGCGNRQPTA